MKMNTKHENYCLSQVAKSPQIASGFAIAATMEENGDYCPEAMGKTTGVNSSLN